MKVCFFGSYVRRNYNMLLKKILEQQGIQVIECQNEITSISEFFSANSKLNYDIMIIPWRGIITLPLAKLISRKPIIYIAFISIYDTLTKDRKLVKPNSLKAKILHFVDSIAYKLSDLSIFESASSMEFAINEFNADRKKCTWLYNGADESQFHPLSFKETNDSFNVLFWGSFIPLHGVEDIVEAARVLSDEKGINFQFCGDGQTKKEMEELSEKYNLKNTKFYGFVEKEKLFQLIQDSDVCIGIFGKSKKADYSLPNKIYQILASQKPLITMNSEGIGTTGLESEINCILVPRNEPEKLAKAILYLKNNSEKRRKLSEEGYRFYIENMSLEKNGKKLLKFLDKVR